MEHALYGSITIGHHVMLATLLFVTGIAGIFLNRKNIITLLMSIRADAVAVNTHFVASTRCDRGGQVFTKPSHRRRLRWPCHSGGVFPQPRHDRC